MERASTDAWGGMQRIQKERPELIEDVLAQVRDEGPIAASELAEERPRRAGPWWDWSDSKRAIEWLFWSGQVTSARRRNFERLYDLPERVLPPKVLAAPTPSIEEAQRRLVLVAARRARASLPSATYATTSGSTWPTSGRASASWSRRAS